MRPITFFRLSLALPLAVPAVAAAIGCAGYFKPACAFLIGSLLLAGVPYLLTAATLLCVSYTSSPKSFSTWLRWAPFLMAAWFGAWAAAGMLFGRGLSGWEFTGFLTAWFIGALYSVLVGYAYLAFVGLIYVVLARLALVQPEHWLSGNGRGS